MVGDAKRSPSITPFISQGYKTNNVLQLQIKIITPPGIYTEIIPKSLLILKLAYIFTTPTHHAEY